LLIDSDLPRLVFVVATVALVAAIGSAAVVGKAPDRSAMQPG
jgi:hypothetical protein